MQPRLLSLIEADTNVGVGLIVSFLLQLALFDVMAIAASLRQNLILTAAFSGLSLVRSYALRRLFNWFLFRIHRPLTPRSAGTRP